MIEFVKKHRKSFYNYGGLLLIFIVLIMLAVIPQTGTPYNSTAIDLGFAQIAWYAVFILSGISMGAYLAYLEFKKLGWKTDLLFDALLWAVPLSIIGSRIYYIIFDPNPSYQNIIDYISIQNGGLSIHGAVITALIFIIIFTKTKKISFWLLADILAIGFLVGQIVGRWGNFMNAEAYGPVIESQFILNILPSFIKDQMLIAGAYHHPTFLYEGIWNFIGLVGLLIIRRKRILKAGDLFAFYLIWYGLGRGAIIEPLRIGGDPSDALRMFGLPTNVVLSLGLFMLGGIVIIFAKKHYIKDQPYYVDMFVDEKIGEINDENNPV
ncbi:MAG: prolipoprotein diacylglyceryl transferase [Bacillota bacterium]